jgi:hypothetical protein
VTLSFDTRQVSDWRRRRRQSTVWSQTVKVDRFRIAGNLTVICDLTFELSGSVLDLLSNNRHATRSLPTAKSAKDLPE